jgi:hypothetical protein
MNIPSDILEFYFFPSSSNICGINSLSAELNPIRHLLALVGAHHIVHVGWVRVNYKKSVNLEVSFRGIQITFWHIYILLTSQPNSVFVYVAVLCVDNLFPLKFN